MTYGLIITPYGGKTNGAQIRLPLMNRANIGRSRASVPIKTYNQIRRIHFNQHYYAHGRVHNVPDGDVSLSNEKLVRRNNFKSYAVGVGLSYGNSYHVIIVSRERIITWRKDYHVEKRIT